MTHTSQSQIALAGIAMVALAVPPLQAAGLDYYSSQASAIVIGTVNTRTESPTQVSFAINIARVLAGGVPGTTVAVNHNWTRTVIVSPPVITDNTPLVGLWFLVGSPATGWDILEPRQNMHGTAYALFLPASLIPPTGPFAYPAGTSLNDSLVFEVAAGIQGANPSSPDADPEALLGAVGSIQSAAVTAVFSAYLTAGSPAFAAVGLAGSLGLGLPQAIQQLTSHWSSISSDPHSSLVISALRDVWRGTDPSSVTELAAFAASAPAGSTVRSAAIRALAAVHTTEALPFLASLLSSAVPSEQERAIYGVSAFANGCPVQTQGNVVSMSYLQCNLPSAYRSSDTLANFGFRPGTLAQESALAQYWQTWWDSNPSLH